MLIWDDKHQIDMSLEETQKVKNGGTLSSVFGVALRYFLLHLYFFLVTNIFQHCPPDKKLPARFAIEKKTFSLSQNLYR